MFIQGAGQGAQWGGGQGASGRGVSQSAHYTPLTPGDPDANWINKIQWDFFFVRGVLVRSSMLFMGFDERRYMDRSRCSGLETPMGNPTRECGQQPGWLNRKDKRNCGQITSFGNLKTASCV